MRASFLAERARVSATPGQITASMGRLLRRLAPVIRLAHRPAMEGTEQLPPAGPYLLIANHSGGTAASELLSLAVLWHATFGLERPIACLAHPVAFYFWPATSLARGLGALPATRERARAALAGGVPLLIFPGAEYESTRPVWQANRVQLAGRRGFLQLAREAGVPIVPMGIRGSHYSAPILWRSTHLLPRLLVIPWLLGIRQFPLTLLGLGGAIGILAVTPQLPWPARLALVWAWLASPFTFFPIVPSTVRYRIGRPIQPEELFPTGTEEELAQAYQRVEAEVQRLVDAGRRATASGRD